MERHVETVDALTLPLLRAVQNRERLAVRVQNFCDKAFCGSLAEWFSSRATRINYKYLHTDGSLRPSQTDRVGPTINEVIPSMLSKSLDDPATAASIAKYLEEARCERDALHRSWDDHYLPIRRVESLLRQIWPSGVRVAHFGNIESYVGVARIETASVTDCSDRNPHVDWLSPVIKPYDEQLSTIVYLQMPKSGGELLLWNVSKYQVLSFLRDDGTLDRHLLSDPMILAPSVGDLIIINTRYPHAVLGFNDGLRIVQTCFVGIRGEDPLELWS
jgi:hypothetical protein